uniref:Glycoprotein n=1 Tax=Blattodean phenui-related virus OKIAV294 TaxID=2746244 RepID=A0A7D7JIV6_9VIRU|nr:glycoprotein [Blattodean phenui-related virus OKIAV294]
MVQVKMLIMILAQVLCIVALPQCSDKVNCYNSCERSGVGMNQPGTCVSPFSCDKGSLLDSACRCSKRITDCVNGSWPGAICSPVGSAEVSRKYFETSEAQRCTEADVRSLDISSEWCHISSDDKVPPSRCSITARHSDIPYIIMESKRIPVSHLPIRKVFSGSIEDSVNRVGPNCTRSDRLTGATPELCSVLPLRDSCKISMSDADCIEIYDSKIEFLVLDLGTCWLPIDCYGTQKSNLYPFGSPVVDFDCSMCWVHCGIEEVVVHLDKGQYHMVELCSNTKCEKKLVSEDLIHFPRTFRDRVSDSRVRANIYGLDGSLYEKDGACKKMEVCDAIKCMVCWEATMNIKCWGAIAWFVALFAVWLLAVVVGTLLTHMHVIIKFLVGTFWLIYRVTRFLFRCCKRTGRASLKRVKQSKIGDSVGSLMWDDDDLVPEKSLSQTIVKQARKPKYYVSRSKFTPDLTSILIISLMISQTQATENECLHFQSISYQTEECTVNNAGVSCLGGTTTTIPLLGRDVTSCLEYRSKDGRLVGVLRLTPVFVGLQCNKELEYITRDHDLVYDSIHMCPHSGPCSGNWCEEVSDGTKVEGMAESHDGVGPGKKFCLRGQACAGAGCFYCTQSCVTIHWHASMKDSKYWEVYRCPSWVPRATVYAQFVDGSSVMDTTLAWNSGSSLTMFGKFKLRPLIYIDEKIPALSRSIMVQNQRGVLIEASPPGQPQPGRIGQLQCATALTSLKDCVIAPNSCVCSANEISGSCQCAQVSLEAAVSQKTLLPQSISIGTLKLVRGEILLELSAQGHLSVDVTSSGSMKAISQPPGSCDLDLVELTGCYSCLQGAKLFYTCRSNDIQSAVLTCNLGSAPISCDPKSSKRSTVLNLASPIIDLTCIASCDKSATARHVTGNLEYHGFDLINKEDVLHILPNVTESAASWNWTGWSSIGSFFSGIFHSIGWLKTVFIIVSAVIFCGISFMLLPMLLAPLKVLKRKQT